MKLKNSLNFYLIMFFIRIYPICIVIGLITDKGFYLESQIIYLLNFLFCFGVMLIFCRFLTQSNSKSSEYINRGFVVVSKELEGVDIEPIVSFVDSLPEHIKTRMIKDGLLIYIEKRKDFYIHPKINGASGYYHPVSNHIKILCDSSMDFNGYGFKVFVHEFAHYVDSTFGGLSSTLEFKNLLFRIRKAEWFFDRSYLGGFSLVKSSRWDRCKPKLFKILYYITKLSYFQEIPYGLTNNRELFAELFAESIGFKLTNLKLPEHYYVNNYTQYYMYIDLEEFNDYVVNMLNGVILKTPKFPLIAIKDAQAKNKRFLEISVKRHSNYEYILSQKVQ